MCLPSNASWFEVRWDLPDTESGVVSHELAIAHEAERWAVDAVDHLDWQDVGAHLTLRLPTSSVSSVGGKHNATRTCKTKLTTTFSLAELDVDPTDLTFGIVAATYFRVRACNALGMCTLSNWSPGLQTATQSPGEIV